MMSEFESSLDGHATAPNSEPFGTSVSFLPFDIRPPVFNADDAEWGHSEPPTQAAAASLHTRATMNKELSTWESLDILAAEDDFTAAAAAAAATGDSAVRVPRVRRNSLLGTGCFVPDELPSDLFAKTTSKKQLFSSADHNRIRDSDSYAHGSSFHSRATDVQTAMNPFNRMSLHDLPMSPPLSTTPASGHQTFCASAAGTLDDTRGYMTPVLTPVTEIVTSPVQTISQLGQNSAKNLVSSTPTKSGLETKQQYVLPSGESHLREVPSTPPPVPLQTVRLPEHLSAALLRRKEFPAESHLREVPSTPPRMPLQTVRSPEHLSAAQLRRKESPAESHLREVPSTPPRMLLQTVRSPEHLSPAQLRREEFLYRSSHGDVGSSPVRSLDCGSPARSRQVASAPIARSLSDTACKASTQGSPSPRRRSRGTPNVGRRSIEMPPVVMGFLNAIEGIHVGPATSMNELDNILKEMSANTVNLHIESLEFDSAEADTIKKYRRRLLNRGYTRRARSRARSSKESPSPMSPPTSTPVFF